MTSARASNVNIEVIEEHPSFALATQVEAKVLIDPVPHAQATQVKTAALTESSSMAMDATQIGMRVLWSPTPNLRATHVTSEAISHSSTLKTRVSQTAIRVLYDVIQLSPTVPTYYPVSNYLFPTLAGLTWNVVKKPKFSTVIAPHVSGREVRVSNYSLPLYEWDMTYEFLRANAFAELQTLMGFFLQRQGTFDTFLYKDPSENNIIVLGAVGAGDGALTVYTLTKTYAGFTEPVGYADPATLRVYFTVGGVTTEQTTGWSFTSPNQIVFVSPPAIGTTITASYTWYYRVRFGEDAQDYNNFMYQLWELKKLSLLSVKP
jgi:uncharacterized protein (TIGR02217 family)